MFTTIKKYLSIFLFILFISATTLTSCGDDDDDSGPSCQTCTTTVDILGTSVTSDPFEACDSQLDSLKSVSADLFKVECQ